MGENCGKVLSPLMGKVPWTCATIQRPPLTPVVQKYRGTSQKRRENAENGATIRSVPVCCYGACAVGPSKMATQKWRETIKSPYGDPPRTTWRHFRFPGFYTYFRLHHFRFRYTCAVGPSKMATPIYFRFRSLPVPGHVTSGSGRALGMRGCPPPQSSTPFYDLSCAPLLLTFDLTSGTRDAIQTSFLTSGAAPPYAPP